MHRFYLPFEQWSDPVCTLKNEEAHHAVQVLRLGAGDKIVVMDGAGRHCTCEIITASRAELRAQVVARAFAPPPSCRITLVQAIPKGKLMESIVQKSTELGVARVVPLLSDRVATRLEAAERREKASKWQQVAVEAIKQSGAVWLPHIEIPVTLREFLQREERFDLNLLGSLQPDSQHPRTYFDAYFEQHQKLPASLALWIGPEGDFTLAEIMETRRAGALPFTMGPLVLRVETAAITALAIASSELRVQRPAA